MAYHDRVARLTPAVVVAALLAALSASAQAPAGKPNLNGIWQAVNTANWDIQTHGPSPGPPALGAIGTIPPGLGVVEGGELPYLPEAVAKKKENFANRWSTDPEIKCYMPGVPRATYMPYPFQILQGTNSIMHDSLRVRQRGPDDQHGTAARGTGG